MHVEFSNKTLYNGFSSSLSVATLIKGLNLHGRSIWTTKIILRYLNYISAKQPLTPEEMITFHQNEQ